MLCHIAVLIGMLTGFASNLAASPAPPSSRMFVSRDGRWLAKVVLTDQLNVCDMQLFKLDHKAPNDLIEIGRRQGVPYPQTVLVDSTKTAFLYYAEEPNKVALTIFPNDGRAGVSIQFGQLINQAEYLNHVFERTLPPPGWYCGRGNLFYFAGDELILDFSWGKQVTINTSTGAVKSSLRF